MSLLGLGIFLFTYLALALGRVPGLRMDRTGVAILGAVLMLVSGVVSMEEAIGAIDYGTIILLYGMMLIAGNLRLAGFFRLTTGWLIRRSRGPLALLVAITIASGVLSAFFVNDIVCLVLTPMVIAVTQRLELNPRPYLLAVASAANVGSVATITGNPQNMMIGSLSGVAYLTFLARLGPVAAVGLALTVAVIAIVYRRDLRARRLEPPAPRPAHANRPLLWKGSIVSVAVVIGFLLGLPISLVAIFGGAALLITRRVKPAKIYGAIDWNLLVLFIGLFIVVEGAERAGVAADAMKAAGHLSLERPEVLTGVVAVLSNLFSNVPAVLLFRPIVPNFSDPGEAWLTIAMASTLAGNLTLLGSVANLIVVEQARANRVEITFFEHAKIGIPLTLVTLVVGLVGLRLAGS
jgi:Na+/H+ antiporter NhaD/arsenite permease-like protein